MITCVELKTRVVCHVKANKDMIIVYLCAKFDDSSFSRSKDIIRAAKSKMNHVNLTTAHLVLQICV